MIVQILMHNSHSLMYPEVPSPRFKPITKAVVSKPSNQKTKPTAKNAKNSKNKVFNQRLASIPIDFQLQINRINNYIKQRNNNLVNSNKAQITRSKDKDEDKSKYKDKGIFEHLNSYF